MSSFADKVRDTKVGANELAIFWISQAGFVYKTPAGKVIYVDPFLSDCVHRLYPDYGYGFRRIMGTPIEAEEVEADYVVSTHSHPDHSLLTAHPHTHALYSAVFLRLSSHPFLPLWFHTSRGGGEYNPTGLHEYLSAFLQLLCPLWL